ncbi:MAG: hypothetical protein ACLP22_05640 [Solirubrobacteraceae bacterium]
MSTRSSLAVTTRATPLPVQAAVRGAWRVRSATSHDMQTPPIDAVLEDGYHPPALAEPVIGMLRALGGDDAAESIAPDRIYTRQAASYVGHYWDL